MERLCLQLTAKLREPRRLAPPEAPARTRRNSKPAVVGHDVDCVQRSVASKRRAPARTSPYRDSRATRRAVRSWARARRRTAVRRDRGCERRWRRLRRAERLQKRIAAIKERRLWHARALTAGGSPSATPPPQNHNADTRRSVRSFAREIGRGAVQPHFDFRAEAAQLARRGTRGQRPADVGVEQTRGIDARDPRGWLRRSAGSRAHPHRAARIRGRTMREIAAIHVRAFLRAEAQQSAIGEPHVIEPRLQVNGCGEPRIARRRRGSNRPSAQHWATDMCERSGGAEIGAQPGTPVGDALRAAGEAQQPVERGQIERGGNALPRTASSGRYKSERISVRRRMAVSYRTHEDHSATTRRHQSHPALRRRFRRDRRAGDSRELHRHRELARALGCRAPSKTSTVGTARAGVRAANPKWWCWRPAHGRYFRARRCARSSRREEIGLEVMEIGAACRTYNVLVGEERQVLAAILLPGPRRDPSEDTGGESCLARPMVRS